ncbi:hypothetical protein HanPI659440_Chr02g0044611 [Helianthus annuus]|uniref:Uncharacterized protein n=1 Tax=Helianthus annuus TaxID=4232 RepID=A0A9K3NZL7_HELAN|nr:hypothetical protein HanXRQr2_Chr02g0058721 [Helianthus annuus]KAJ0614801.1 hypothetical protein HanIR_Chr02g0066581 [Helianthus annuus]KAJ0618343.1 hypothetical protein HanHA89_Chr02g0052111 [Helianthus annuus]KAJ0805000.1 hypothetical protein HanPI659440_Chr02g0044611 [Helianthus annuus]
MTICCLFMMFVCGIFFIVVQWFCKITLMILCPIQKYTVHTNNQFCWVLQLPTILYCSRHHVVTIMYFAV